MNQFLNETKELKEKGNEYLIKALKMKNQEKQFEIFQKAMSCYHQAYLNLRSVDQSEDEQKYDLVSSFIKNKKITDEELLIVQELKISVMSNMANIYYKKSQFQKCLKFAMQVIQLDPQNERNLLRKFHCELELDTNKAENTLNQYFSNNQELKNKLLARQEKDAKNLYGQNN